MRKTQYKIYSSDLNELQNEVLSFIKPEYIKSDDNFFVVGDEQYYFRTNSTQLNMIIANFKNSIIEIDIIGAAGGSGLLNLTWGSESEFIKVVEKRLKNYCEKNCIKYELLG